MQTEQNILQRFALRVSDWSEKWFPDSYIFALLGVIIVAIAAIGIGAPAQDVAISFGDGTSAPFRAWCDCIGRDSQPAYFPD